MTAVDRAVEEVKREQQQQKRTTTTTTVEEERHWQSSTTTTIKPDVIDIIYDRPGRRNKEAPAAAPTANIADQAPSIRLLMVGDYSLYEKFLNLYGNNHSAAYQALRLYLEAIFEQVFALDVQKKIFE